MGKMRIRNRHPGTVYFCLTALMFLSLLNCTTMVETKQQREGRHYLTLSQKLLAQGDYEGALAENQDLLALSNRQPPADAALFNMGLIYAHWKNPSRDYEKSLGFFNKVIDGYPRSPLVEEARIWVMVLQENEKLRQVIEKFKEVDITVEEKQRKKAR